MDKNKKNLLLITANVHPSSAQGIRYINLINHFINNFNITHLTFDKELLNLEFCENFSVINITNKNEYINLLRKFLYYFYNKISFPDRFVFELKRYRKKISQILERKEIDTVIICMTPFSFYRLGKMIKSINPHLNLIADLSDPFTGSATVLIKASFLNSIRRKFESKYIKFFDKVVVLNEKIKSYYSNTFNLPLNRFEVIEQGIDEFFLKKIEAENQKKLNDSIKLIYAGSFYRVFREPFKLYKAIERSPHKLELDIYGGIKKKFLPKNSNRIFYKGLISSIELVKKYAQADIIVMIDNSIGIQVPGKTIECLAISKPVLFIYENEESPSLLYVRKANGVIICKNNIESIYEGIYKIVNYDHKYNFDYDISEYTWKTLSLKYQNIIENM